MGKPVHFKVHFITYYLLVCLYLFSTSCGKDPVDTVDCTGLTPTYSVDTKPILDASCAQTNCHDSVTKENGYDFSTYATAMPISQQENFLGAIQHKGGFKPMPESGPKLSQNKIDLLTCWVQNGSPE